MVSITCKNQSNFRQTIQKRDKVCLVTRYHSSECDAAHIVPRDLCERESLPFIYDSGNGLLLSKGLHSLFDKMVWSFDFYDVKQIENRHCFKVLISPNYRQKTLSITPFLGSYIALPEESIPFIYYHYKTFIKINYQYEKNAPNINDDNVFKYLYTHPYTVFMDHLLKQTFRDLLIMNGLLKPQNKLDLEVNSILKHRIAQYGSKQPRYEYHVYWDYYPLTASSWEPESHVSPYWKNWIELKKETRLDPDWIA